MFSGKAWEGRWLGVAPGGMGWEYGGYGCGVTEGIGN